MNIEFYEIALSLLKGRSSLIDKVQWTILKNPAWA